MDGVPNKLPANDAVWACDADGTFVMAADCWPPLDLIAVILKVVLL